MLHFNDLTFSLGGWCWHQIWPNPAQTICFLYICYVHTACLSRPTLYNKILLSIASTFCTPEALHMELYKLDYFYYYYYYYYYAAVCFHYCAVTVFLTCWNHLSRSFLVCRIVGLHLRVALKMELIVENPGILSLKIWCVMLVISEQLVSQVPNCSSMKNTK